VRAARHRPVLHIGKPHVDQFPDTLSEFIALVSSRALCQQLKCNVAQRWVITAFASGEDYGVHEIRNGSVVHRRGAWTLLDDVWQNLHEHLSHLRL
jgi:hypothetical protein